MEKDLDNLFKSNTIVYTIRWNPTKSARLKRVRGVSFEEIIQAQFLGFRDSHNRENQQLMLFEYRNYIWLVPFVRKGNEIFLKTLYPSRKYTKIYKKGEQK